MRKSEGLVLTGVGGIALAGNALFHYTDFRSAFTRTFHKGRGGNACRGRLRELAGFTRNHLCFDMTLSYGCLQEPK